MCLMSALVAVEQRLLLAVHVRVGHTKSLPLTSNFDSLDSAQLILNPNFLDAAHHPLLNSQFSILNSQFPILNSRFSILNSQFSILNSQLGWSSILIFSPSTSRWSKWRQLQGAPSHTQGPVEGKPLLLGRVFSEIQLLVLIWSFVNRRPNNGHSRSMEPWRRCQTCSYQSIKWCTENTDHQVARSAWTTLYLYDFTIWKQDILVVHFLSDYSFSTSYQITLLHCGN